MYPLPLGKCPGTNLHTLEFTSSSFLIILRLPSLHRSWHLFLKINFYFDTNVHCRKLAIAQSPQIFHNLNPNIKIKLSLCYFSNLFSIWNTNITHECIFLCKTISCVNTFFYMLLIFLLWYIMNPTISTPFSILLKHDFSRLYYMST